MNTIEAICQIANELKLKKVCVCRIDYSVDDSVTEMEMRFPLFHRGNVDYTFIDVNECMDSILSNMALNGYVANSQIVLDNGAFAHLPMMDFKCEVNNENTEEVIRSLHLLHIEKGYLLNSGSSYHFIGSEPLSENDYKVVLYRSFLLAPFTDGRWIAHQLINGSSNLRMGAKDGIIPEVIKYLV